MAADTEMSKPAQANTASAADDAPSRAAAAPVPESEEHETAPPADSEQLDDERAEPASGPDRKRAPRFIFQVPVEIELGRESGRGRVQDMSKSGARIEQATIHPDPGSKVKLRFRFYENSPPIAVNGNVVRTTETGGFAIVYANLDPRTRRALMTLLPKIGTAQPYSPPREARETESLTLSIPSDVHARCTEAAKKAGRSLNEWLIDILEEAADGS